MKQNALWTAGGPPSTTGLQRLTQPRKVSTSRCSIQQLTHYTEPPIAERMAADILGDEAAKIARKQAKDSLDALTQFAKKLIERSGKA